MRKIKSDEEIKSALDRCGTSECKSCEKCPYYTNTATCVERMLGDALELINRQQVEVERLNKENDELKNGFFQEHYKEIECQELLSVKEAWRKESLHNIDLEAEIERLNGYINSNCLDCAGCTQDKCDYINIRDDTIDEFAERLRGEMLGKYCVYFNNEITNAIIDNLVKEMVGDAE